MKLVGPAMGLLPRRGRLAILVGALFALSLASTAIGGNESATIWVAKDGLAGPNGCRGNAVAHTTIQAAVDASDANDTVLVCPGKYTGLVWIVGAQHNGLTLKSVQEGAATIKAPDTNNVLVYVLNANRVRILGFRLVAPTVEPCDNLGYGIRVEDSRHIEIRDNDIRATGTDTLGDCGYFFGIHVTGSSALIRDNVVTDFQGIGIFVTNTSTVELIDNSIRYYHAAHHVAFGSGAGIRIVDSSGKVVRNAVVGLSTAGSTTAKLADGLSVEGTNPGNIVIRGNVIRRTHNGLSLETGGALVEDNVSLENAALDCSDTTTGGTGTAGTDNTWVGNLGDPAKSNPTGICALP